MGKNALLSNPVRGTHHDQRSFFAQFRIISYEDGRKKCGVEAAFRFKR